MEKKFDFSGWATKANLKCSDGRIITEAAFKHCDGMTVPLVWGHQHNDPQRVLGHALLEYRAGEGMYTYAKFNDTEQGQNAKLLVEHGDVVALSIYANQLKQNGPNVLHGAIREVSLVLAGANPGAFIENVIRHSDDGEPITVDEEATLFTDEGITLYHEDDPKDDKGSDDNTDDKKSEDGKTVKEIWESIEKKLDPDEMNLVYGMIGAASDNGSDDNADDKDNNETVKHNEESEGGDDTMKKNVFDTEDQNNTMVLSHADQEAILKLAKSSAVGSLQQAISMYCEEKGMTLAHGVDDLETLFPEFKNIDPGAPELMTRDQGWVGVVMKKVKKSPFSRIRTRKANARIAALRAKGYKKGEQKTLMANIKLLGRQTEPQTIYIKDELNRDDIIDITDFSIVDYEKGIMKMTLEEEVATAIMLGDGRDDGDPDKIHEDRIRPIWKDEELYTHHVTIDIDAVKKELQGEDTGTYFGTNFVYAEAIIQTALYARETFEGSGTPDFYCDPHLVNVMLLARDRNGHRLYKTKADLAAALNVGAIYEGDQFANKTRVDGDGKTKKLLGLFVNLADYQVGATKGGEITTFQQFDIDFNKEKFLMECRCSGALTDPHSAIALEELVEDAEG